MVFAVIGGLDKMGWNGVWLDVKEPMGDGIGFGADVGMVALGCGVRMSYGVLVGAEGG